MRNHLLKKLINEKVAATSETPKSGVLDHHYKQGLSLWIKREKKQLQIAKTVMPNTPMRSSRIKQRAEAENALFSEI